MKMNNGVVYETITVLAIHILNASEMPFEKEGTELVGRYQRFLSECSEIMTQDGGCMDIMISSNGICSIFTGRCQETVRKVTKTAVRIEDLVERVNRRNTYDSLERMILGMGIACGTAVMIKVSRQDQKNRNVWLGPVMEKADFLSRSAINNGERKIMAEHRIGDIVCDIIMREEL